MGTALVSQLCTSGTSSNTDVTEGSVRLCENRADGECTLSFKLRGGEFPEFPGLIPSFFFSFLWGFISWILVSCSYLHTCRLSWSDQEESAAQGVLRQQPVDRGKLPEETSISFHTPYP